MKNLRVEISDGIATVTIDRPPVNAVNNETMIEMAEVFNSFADNRDVRVAIFTGAGDKAFIAGVDLNTFGAAEPDEKPLSEVTDSGAISRNAMWAITDCAVPVIAAVNGYAIGAGLAFSACCDIIVASDNAKFGTTEINVGLLGASAHLSTLVGRHKAREMFFTGELVSAEDLHRIGSIRAVVPRADLDGTARELASTLASKSPLALRLAKASMNHVEGLPLKEAYRIEQSYTHRLLGFEDSAEARAAFFEKREPKWKLK